MALRHFLGEWALVCHLSRCVSRVYGNEPPHEHHRRPLLANARKRDATHEERPGLSIPLGPVWSRVWSCLGRCHFVVESLIGGWGRAAPTRSGSRHERRKYRQVAHHAPLTLSRLGPPATAAPWHVSNCSLQPINPAPRGSDDCSLEAEGTPGVYFGLTGKYQWRLVAVGTWCCREKKSGELYFE